MQLERFAYSQNNAIRLRGVPHPPWPGRLESIKTLFGHVHSLLGNFLPPKNLPTVLSLTPFLYWNTDVFACRKNHAISETGPVPTMTWVDWLTAKRYLGMFTTRWDIFCHLKFGHVRNLGGKFFAPPKNLPIVLSPIPFFLLKYMRFACRKNHAMSETGPAPTMTRVVG